MNHNTKVVDAILKRISTNCIRLRGFPKSMSNVVAKEVK